MLLEILLACDRVLTTATNEDFRSGFSLIGPTDSQYLRAAKPNQGTREKMRTNCRVDPTLFERSALLAITPQTLPSTRRSITAASTHDVTLLLISGTRRSTPVFLEDAYEQLGVVVLLEHIDDLVQSGATRKPTLAYYEVHTLTENARCT